MNVKTKLATYIGKKITEKGFNHSLLFTLEEIRTPDLLVRSQTLYPTGLQAQNNLLFYNNNKIIVFQVIFENVIQVHLTFL